MLELWGIRSTYALPSLPGPLWSEVEAPDRVLSMDQIELNCVLMLNWIACNRIVLIFKLRINAKLNWNSSYAKLNCLKKNFFWDLTVWKQKLYLY